LKIGEIREIIYHKGLLSRNGIENFMKTYWNPIENQAFWRYETILLSPHASKNEKYQI
jgi:hypothetical protein